MDSLETIVSLSNIVCSLKCVHVCASVHGGQKRISDLLELELQTGVSHQTWVPGTNLPSLEEQYALVTSEHPSSL